MAKKSNKSNGLKSNDESQKDKAAGLFIPAGLLIGLGLGFFFGNIPAFLFLGLGIGFLFFAMAKNR
jgi:hypothetical protein